MPANTDPKQDPPRSTDQDADRLKQDSARDRRELMAKVRRVPAIHFRRGPDKPKDGEER